MRPDPYREYSPASSCFLEAAAALFASAPVAGTAAAGATTAATAASAGSLVPFASAAPTVLSPVVAAPTTAIPFASTLPAAAVSTGAAQSVFSMKNILATLGLGSAVTGGFMNAADLEAQRELAELRAKQEITKGIEEGNELNRRLIEALNTNIAQAAGSGLSLEGTENINQALSDDADVQFRRIKSGAETASAVRRAESKVLRRRAGSAVLQGFANAAAFGSLIRRA
ncbi:MAG: hypothetical protein QNJ94_18570 [Alphaproteobacteria bacterium]|nr:hypothetical protein [Alphaproteobacteria bacterium]